MIYSRNHKNLYFCVLKDGLAFVKDVTKYLQPLGLFIVYLHKGVNGNIQLMTFYCLSVTSTGAAAQDIDHCNRSL